LKTTELRKKKQRHYSNFVLKLHHFNKNDVEEIVLLNYAFLIMHFLLFMLQTKDVYC